MKLKQLLIVASLLFVIGAGLYLAPKQQRKDSLEMQQKVDSLVAQIEHNLVTNHVRHAQAYLRILEIQKERTLRSVLMKIVYDSQPAYDPEKSLGPAKAMLTNAVAVNDQVLAREAVQVVRKALITYGVRLEQLSRANYRTKHLATGECIKKDEDTLNELKNNFAASLRKFRLNGTVETAEQSFIDGWLALSALGLIGPDYVGKYGSEGRTEVRRIRTELDVLREELATFSASTSLKSEEYERIKNQSAHILRKTDEFDNLLGKFDIALK